MKVANKINISFFVVVAVLTAIAMSIFYMAGKINLQKAIYAHLSTTAHSRAHHIETFLKTQKNAAIQLSESIVLEEFLSAGKEDPDYIQRFNRAIRRLKATEKANEFTSELFVIDKNGKIAASSDRSKIGLDRSTDSYFLGGKKGPYIKDAYYSKTMAEKCLTFSAPIKDSNTGEFLGVIVARIGLDMLNEITTDRAGLGKTGEIHLINKYGYMITPSRFAKDTFLKQKIDTENTRNFFEDWQKFGGKTHSHEAFIYRDYRGVKVLGVHDHINDMQWCLCAEIDKKEALAPLTIIKLISIIIFCAVLGIVWTVGTLVSRGITAPIHRLHKGVEIIGKGNLDYKVGTDVKDEIGQLSRAFDEMSENLGQRTTSIDKLNKEVAERKKTEKEVRDIAKFPSENPNPVLRVQKDGKILYSNDAAVPLLAKWKAKVGGVVPAKWRRLVDLTFESEKAISNEEEVDGSIFSFVVAPILDGCYANLYARDITKHKKAEAKLKQVAEEWIATFDSITDMVSIHDKDFKIIRANKAFASAFKMKPGEIIGKTCCELIHGTKEPPPSCPHKRTLDTGKPNCIEFFEPHLGIHIEVSVSPLFDENGQVMGSVHITKDITERKQAEKELEKTHEKLLETSRMAGMAEVAADVLHNVGNVLNSINVSTTVIKEKVTSSELANLEKVASIINEHIDDLGTFLTKDPQGKHIPVYLTEVSKCLTDEQTDIISRLRALVDNVQHIKDIIGMQQLYAKVSSAEVQTSLGKLAEDAIQINSAGLERHGTQLIRKFEELGDVEINKQKVLQILVNLISNAKYALSGSNKEEKLMTIRIYKHCEDRFRIEVADNGVGISEDNLTKIFSHGFTTKKNGHGFGLHSCTLAAKEMGGSLTVHSDGVGQGTTFTLELPLKPVGVVV